MTCHNCHILMKKFGFFGKLQRVQRYRCIQCGRTFSAIPDRPFDNMRVPVPLATQAIHLLVEGMGIRACERLTGLHRDTVTLLLEVAGQKSARLLDRKIRNVPVQSVQADELWCFVGHKQARNIGANPETGDQYTFLAIDRVSKLILTHRIGKRTYVMAQEFIDDLKLRVDGRFQLTTDQFQGYLRAVFNTFYGDVDFAQQQKIFGTPCGLANEASRRYSPPVMIRMNRQIHIGDPDPKLISTSHVERTNLSVRLFNRRFTRLTLGYSKKLANLKHAVALFVAHFNFCRVHGTIRATPAMAAGLTDHVWKIEELLAD